MANPPANSPDDQRKALEAELKAKMVELHGLYRKGHASLAKALMMDDGDLDAIYSVGLRLLAQQKYLQAAQVMSNLCMIEQYDARYWRTLGLALMKTKETRLAMTAFGMALANNPDDIPTLTYRGEQLILEGNKDEARKDLERVIEIGKSATDDLPFIKRAKGLLRYATSRH
jgi:tetratricopeptide (TPR) repeat protein